MNQRYMLSPLFGKIGILVITYSALIVAVTYYIGFIFVQGSVMIFTNATNIWNMGYEYIPASHSLYFVHGITFLHYKLGDITIGVLIASFYYIALYYPRSHTNHSIVQFIDKWRCHKFVNYPIKFLIVMISPIIWLILYPKFINLNDAISTFAIASFFMSLVIINNEYNKTEPSHPHVYKLIASLFLITSLVTNIMGLTTYVFIQGDQSQDKRLDSMLVKGTQKGSITLVYGEKTLDYYFSIDLTSEYFIGYNIETESIDKIPKDKIKKIESHSVTKYKEVKKYPSDKNAQANLSKDVKDQISVVKNYYEYGPLVKRDPVKLLALFSDNYYQGGYGLLSPDLLKKEWTVLDTYNGLPKNEYIGVEISLPENKTVWVRERWKGQLRFTVFTLVEVGDEWKIDGVNRNWQPFKFIK